LIILITKICWIWLFSFK